MSSLEINKTQLEQFKSSEVIHFPEAEGTVWINNVFGVNKDGLLPARFLSGFISTFSLAKTIQELSGNHLTSRVRIFRPINITKHVNGISQSSIEDSIKLGSEMIQLLAIRHFPAVDFFIEDDEEVSDNALQVLSDVASIIELNCEESHLQKTKESGRTRGGHLGEKNAILYSAHHPFGWSDLHHKDIFESVPPVNVINTLPPSEKKYSEIRRVVRQVINADSELFVPISIRKELIINMCGLPHYLFIEDSNGHRLEPSLNEIINANCAEVLRDMKLRSKTEPNSFLSENLRRAMRDLEKLFSLFAQGNMEVLQEQTFLELTGRSII